MVRGAVDGTKGVGKMEGQVRRPIVNSTCQRVVVMTREFNSLPNLQEEGSEGSEGSAVSGGPGASERLVERLRPLDPPALPFPFLLLARTCASSLRILLTYWIASSPSIASSPCKISW